jgi:streptogramin lyase
VSRARVALLAVAVSVGAVAWGPPALAAASGAPGDVVVANAGASGSPDFLPQLTLIPANGSAASPLTPIGALEGAEDVVMLEPTHALVGGYGTLARVDITTGTVSPIALDTPLTSVSGIAIDSLGRILISDDGPSNGPTADGRVLRVDPSTGVVTVLSSGNHLANPEAIAVTPNGQIYVADYENASAGEVININPTSGAQTVTASAGLIFPTGITALPNGKLLVADQSYGGYPGALVTIDPQTTAESPLAIGSLTGDRPLGIRRVTTDGAGNAFVASTAPSVDRINLATGVSTLLSANTLVTPLGLSVIPTTEKLAPTCSVAAIRRAGAGGHDQEDVAVRDLGSGLETIGNIHVTNGSVHFPEFPPRTPNTVTVTATKTTQGQSTVWSFDATDADGNVRHCS